MKATSRSLVVAVLASFVVLDVGACGGDHAAPLEAVGSSASADSTECNSGPYVDGVDVYDGTGTIDWTASKASGLTFAIIKATQGNYDTQTTFATNWAGAKAAGVARSAYHFFDPTVDGVEQANYFLGVMGSLEPGDMPPMLDIECPDGDPNCMYTGGSGDEAASVITSRMNDWLTTVKAATGVAPIVYSFESYFSSNGVDTTGLSAYPLDIAYPTTTTCFGVPSPWPTATIWQNSWTGTVAGISGGVDTDRFLGTLAQFQAFLGGFAAPSEDNGNNAVSLVNWPDGHVELFAETTKGRDPSRLHERRDRRLDGAGVSVRGLCVRRRFGHVAAEHCEERAGLRCAAGRQDRRGPVRPRGLAAVWFLRRKRAFAPLDPGFPGRSRGGLRLGR